MANYSELLADIASAIYENHNEEIDALDLKGVLDEMVQKLGDGYLVKGVAGPSTNPGSPDTNVAYFAYQSGTYTNFDSIQVSQGEVALLLWDGEWQKGVTGMLSTGAIVDNLTTNDATKVLSAKQGKVLKDLQDQGYLIAGVAHPGDSAVSLSGKVAYIASEAGTYTNKGGLVVADGEVAILKYNGSWSKEVTGAATAAEVSALGQKVSGYFVNENVSVNNNSQRIKNYTIAAGSKVVLKVSKVSGTSATWNAYWIKGGGNEAIFTGYPMGCVSDILTIPNDATGVQIFMHPAASGNVNKVEIWDATLPPIIADKVGEFGVNYLTNRKILSKSFNLSVGNALMDLVTIDELLFLPRIKGDVYAYISGDAKLKEDMSVRFWDTSNTSAATSFVSGRDLQFRNLFKIYDSNKVLLKVNLNANSIQEAGTLNLDIFAMEPSAEFAKYPLKGRKIMCFGDSITEFRGANGTDGLRYSDILQKLSGAEVQNAGIGGTRLAYRAVPSTSPAGNQDCVAAFDIVSLITAWAANDFDNQDAALASGYLTDDKQTLYAAKLAMLKVNPVEAFDIITIWGGSNDYTGGSTIGTDSASNTDKGTIYGAINSMVSALLAAKPTLKIVFFEPIIRMFENSVSLATSSDVYVHPNGGGKTLPEFCEYIEDAVKLNHEPFCDWYWDLGWNVYNFTEYFGTDYTHPYLGFRYIAERMYRYLLSV